MSKRPRTVSCPRCGNPVDWHPDSRWRPFCSERCKLLDLGAWANEDYRVPADDDKSVDQPPGDEPRR